MCVKSISATVLDRKDSAPDRPWLVAAPVGQPTPPPRHHERERL